MQYELNNLEKIILTLRESYDKDDKQIMGWHKILLDEKERLQTVFMEEMDDNAAYPDKVAQYSQYHLIRLARLKSFTEGLPPKYSSLITDTLDDLALGIELAAGCKGMTGQHSKAHFDLSVQELALLSRVMWELRVITVSFKSDLIRLMTENFTTKNTGMRESISAQHFRRRMGTVTLQSCDSLHRVLKSILRRIEELRLEAIKEKKLAGYSSSKE